MSERIDCSHCDQQGNFFLRSIDLFEVLDYCCPKCLIELYEKLETYIEKLNKKMWNEYLIKKERETRFSR